MKDATRVKILILGESSVGKSSLLTQFVEQKFTESHMPTIGVQYKQKVIELSDKSLIKVQIWDTAGTQRFRTITPVYYRNVDGVLLVFDITDNKSFETINYWVEQLNEKADIASIELMLAGNKTDLESSRQVKRQQAENVSKKIGINYAETSAKNYQSTEKASSEEIEIITWGMAESCSHPHHRRRRTSRSQNAVEECAINRLVYQKQKGMILFRVYHTYPLTVKQIKIFALLSFQWIVMQNKNHRSKNKTLCTIETSDIDLQDTKPKMLAHLAGTKNNKQKEVQSPTLKKKSIIKQKTPVKYWLQANSHKRSQEKSPCGKNKLRSNLNKTISKQKSRVKTQYSTFSDIVVKSILSKSSNKIKSKLLSPLEQTYNMQTYQIVEQLQSNKKQKVYVARKADKLYIMRKTKDPELKVQYENQAFIKQKLINIKWRNLVKLVKMYTQKNWVYAIYQFSGSCLSWDNPSHCQVIHRILHNQGAVLKHIIKQTSRGINQLSSKGYVHSSIRLQNICMKIHELKTTIKVQGNVRLANLRSNFHIKDKNMLLSLPNCIYTPPEIINLKLFENGLKFDRELIEYISYYDQPWYVDIWALGVMILQLIAGQEISIEKTNKNNALSVRLELQDQSEQESTSRNEYYTNQITLSDILEAQKSLLIQTEAQIQKVAFDRNLQGLLLRMLSINPLMRPNPKEIIKDL